MYSEICEQVDKRSFRGYNFFRILRRYIENGDHHWFRRFYVEDGILCYEPRVRRNPPKPPIESIKISDNSFYSLYDGLWYLITEEQRSYEFSTESLEWADEIGGDLIIKRKVYSKGFDTIRHKRQVNSKTIKQIKKFLEG